MESSALVTRSWFVRSALASVLIVACQQAAPPAPTIAARVPVEDLHHVAIQPCPLDLGGAIAHEMFAACSPPPYGEPISVCPRGECPKPCSVEIDEQACATTPPCIEAEQIVYDARGRFVKTTPDDSAMAFQPQSCSYDGDRLARCDDSSLVEIVGRDSDGRIATVSDGETIDQFIPRYRWSGDTVSSWDAGREASTFEFDSGHRIVAREDRDRAAITRTTYTYNAAGDVHEIRTPSAVTTVDYDDRRRPVALVVKALPDGVLDDRRKLAWDGQDRLVRDTMFAADGTIDRVFTYSYECR